MSGLRKAGERLVDALLPHRCAACGEESASAGFCAACFGQLRPVTRPHCDRCATPFETPVAEGSWCGACHADPPPWSRARAVWRYDAASRGPILAFKHADRLDLTGLLAGLLHRAGSALLEGGDAVIVPVPLHWRRLAWRSYNQASLLADGLAARSALPVDRHVLRRIRATVPQQQLGRDARLTNLTRAFAVTERKRIDAKRIILVDDVLTTGATAAACSKALLKAGAASVDLLVLARVVQPRNLPI